MQRNMPHESCTLKVIFQMEEKTMMGVTIAHGSLQIMFLVTITGVHVMCKGGFACSAISYSVFCLKSSTGSLGLTNSLIHSDPCRRKLKRCHVGMNLS